MTISRIKPFQTECRCKKGNMEKQSISCAHVYQVYFVACAIHAVWVISNFPNNLSLLLTVSYWLSFEKIITYHNP